MGLSRTRPNLCAVRQNQGIPLYHLECKDKLNGLGYRSVPIFLSSWLLSVILLSLSFSLQVSTEGRGGELSGRKNQASVWYPVCFWGSRISQKEADREEGMCTSLAQYANTATEEHLWFLSPTLQPSLYLCLLSTLSPSSSSFFHLSQVPPLSLPPFLSRIHSLHFLLSLHVGECGGRLHQTSAGHFPRKNLLYCDQGGHVSCHGNKH